MRLLSVGSVGEDVKKLQDGLNEIYIEQLAVDGIFGPHTKEMVLAFQGDEDLVVDGIVGPKTWMALFAEVPDDMPKVSPAEEDDPPWIRWAKSKLGVYEFAGTADNPEIISWMKLTTLPRSLWHDVTAWCAVFVNAAITLNGVPGIRSARAVDWLKFGKKVDKPVKGAIAIFDWGDGTHHANFVLRDLGEGKIECIGGNQNNAVTIKSYPKSKVMGYRLPL